MSGKALSDLEVHFPSTGVRIKPYSVDYKVQQQKLEYSKIEVSRAAGELIAGTIDEDPIPAVLSLNGSNICRLCADEDSVNHVEDISWITLRDPRTILENGSLQWEPEKTTLGEAFWFIYNSVEDPNDVLDGFHVVGEIDRRETERQYNGSGQRWLDRNAPDWLKNATLPFSEEKLLITEKLEGGFRFRGDTPLEALSKVQETFALDSWVTPSGVLTIGQAGEQAQVGVVGEERGDLRLSDHHIVEQALPVTAVGIRGTYTEIWTPGERHPFENTGSDKVFQLNSTAEFTGASRQRTKYIGPRNVSGFRELEQIAVNELRRAIGDSASGSVTINAAASEDADLDPRDLSLGDILVIPEIDRDCHKQVRAGAYTVSGLTHRISARDGWMITINVARFITSDNISVRSEVNGPETDGWAEAEQFEHVFQDD